MDIPVANDADILYWNKFVAFLNKHKGKSFTVQMDGLNYSLHAGM